MNAFCNLSRKKSQRHFRADFWVGVASRCIEQWKLNLELRSNTNATTADVAKITGERGGGGGGGRERKCLCVIILVDQKIASSLGGKMRLGYPIARATHFCLLPDTF